MGYGVSVTAYGLTIPTEKIADAWAALTVWCSEECEKIEDLIGEQGFCVAFADNGDLVFEEFTGEKWYDSIEEMFRVIAPFVNDDTVYCEGEDSYLWGYRFEAGQIIQLKGETVYHDVGPLTPLP